MKSSPSFFLFFLVVLVFLFTFALNMSNIQTYKGNHTIQMILALSLIADIAYEEINDKSITNQIEDCFKIEYYE